MSDAFSEAETNYALDYLFSRKADVMSGNGFKPKAHSDLAEALRKKFPHRPVRSKNTCQNRIQYVKRIYEDYEFVRGKSGTGWDDEKKQATAEAEFVQSFVEEHGTKYARCFKSSCPYYDRCANLFGGNKANGANVFHPKQKKTKASSKKEENIPPHSKSKQKKLRKQNRQPLATVDNDMLDLDLELIPDDSPASSTSVARPFDDELLPPPSRKRQRAPSDSNDDEGPSQRDRSISGGSSVARRNAEAGTQLARSLDRIGDGMGTPIVTKQDTTHMSHIDEVMELLAADPTLLPEDPDGAFFAAVADDLGEKPFRARIFIKAPNRAQRVGFLKLLFRSHGMDVPLDYA
ncbi:hypothetical protein GGX14DRAFT_580907 [Mycena pura]|uniref:Myb/SANT-like domain-containing protein n=1 Tax=Mycena pura TaxID=153505 RepID=A0AAD6UN34_9AGAR|nr:hypothetical protein GGX14DRAFT_580907 [Mycena pura]